MSRANNGNTLATLGIALALAAFGAVGTAGGAPFLNPTTIDGVPNGGANAAAASEILDRWAPVASAAGMAHDSWREIYGIQLSRMSPQQLARLQALKVPADGTARQRYDAFTKAYLSAQMTAYVKNRDVQAGKAVNPKLGSPLNDQVYLPIPPCRIVDTRFRGGAIGRGQSRSFFFYNGAFSWSWLDGGFFAPGQGGIAGQANVVCPDTTLSGPGGGTLGTAAPTAAVATITATNTSAAGNFIVWSGVGTPPTSSVLNWSAGQIIANTTVIRGSGRFGTPFDFGVYLNGTTGFADVVVDVVGYFVENHATPLDCTSVVNGGEGSPMLPHTSYNLGYLDCSTGYTGTGFNCGYAGDLPDGIYLSSGSPTTCTWRNTTEASFPSTFNFQATTTCCRVPGQEPP